MGLSETMTFVGFTEDTTIVGTALFVCASAVPPQDNATNEITVKYSLRFPYFLSAKVFIIFNGLNFQNISGESPRIRTLRNAMRRNTKIWFNEKRLQTRQIALSEADRNQEAMQEREGRGQAEDSQWPDKKRKFPCGELLQPKLPA